MSGPVRLRNLFQPHFVKIVNCNLSRVLTQVSVLFKSFTTAAHSGFAQDIGIQNASRIGLAQLRTSKRVRFAGAAQVDQHQVALLAHVGERLAEEARVERGRIAWSTDEW